MTQQPKTELKALNTKEKENCRKEITEIIEMLEKIENLKFLRRIRISIEGYLNQ